MKKSIKTMNNKKDARYVDHQAENLDSQVPSRICASDCAVKSCKKRLQSTDQKYETQECECLIDVSERNHIFNAFALS